MSELSVQLYTVREALAAGLRWHVREARVVRVHSGRAVRARSTSPTDCAMALPENGLAAPTTHVHLLGEDQDAVCALAAELGIQTVIEPYVDPARWQTETGVSEVAAELNAAAIEGGRLRSAGRLPQPSLRTRVHDRRRHALEVLAAQLAPEVVLEVDTYWAYAGGADVPGFAYPVWEIASSLCISRTATGASMPANRSLLDRVCCRCGTSSTRLLRRSASSSWMTRKPTCSKPYAAGREFLLADRA